MSSFPPSPLRLVKPEQEQPDSYLLERRINRRRGISGHVTAVQTKRDEAGTRNRICSLLLVDMSDTGLGALSQEPIEPDSAIAVFLQAHGPERGFDLTGTVVRCGEDGNGRHKIGIRLDSRMAA